MDLQDHKGNEVIHHAENDGEARVDHRDRPNAEKAENGVEDAFVLQNAHPRIGAHEHIDPCRHRDEQDHDGVRAAVHLRDGIGDGVAERDADESREHGDVERAAKHLHEHGVGDKALEVIEGELKGQHLIAGNGEGVEHDEQHRQHDHHADPGDVGVRHGTELLHHCPSFFMT